MLSKNSFIFLTIGKYKYANAFNASGTDIVIVFLLVILGICFVPLIRTKELKGLQYIANILSGEFIERGSDANVDDDDIQTKLISTDVTNLIVGFVGYVSHSERHICLPVDETEELARANNESARMYRKRAPIKVKCLSNNETTNATLLVIDSLKEVTTLLGPFGNVTKRSQPGICALILFYTKSCVSSSMAAPHMNALPKYFPDIQMGAIDSFRFHSVNTDFGIIALPTLMLFHRGRPVVKFNESQFTVNNFVKFIGTHTDIQPITPKVFVTSDDFRGPLPNNVEKETNHCLWLAWVFIGLVIVYHFVRSIYFAQIIEVIKRNWRESSEAQQ